MTTTCGFMDGDGRRQEGLNKFADLMTETRPASCFVLRHLILELLNTPHHAFRRVSRGGPPFGYRVTFSRPVFSSTCLPPVSRLLRPPSFSNRPVPCAGRGFVFAGSASRRAGF